MFSLCNGAEENKTFAKNNLLTLFTFTRFLSLTNFVQYLKRRKPYVANFKNLQLLHDSDRVLIFTQYFMYYCKVGIKHFATFCLLLFVFLFFLDL